MKTHLRILIRGLLTITLLLQAIGCANQQTVRAKADSYETLGKDPRRDTEKAHEENLRAVALIAAAKYDKAEEVLKRALAADVMYGPAHNNLGKVYYHTNKLYLAAWEFDYASKLMPNVPEPRNNLGMVYEDAGNFDNAVKKYGEAMQLEPDNFEFIANSARARVLRGDSDDQLRELLQKVVMRDERPEWNDWARQRLSHMGRSIEK
jgi:Flp pilus assembly protein TadD